MLALASSFHVRRRITQRRWRQLHYASFGAFALALGHALHAGTDLQATRGLVFAAVALSPVVWLTFVRILSPGRRAPVRRPAATPVVEPARLEREREPVAAGGG